MFLIINVSQSVDSASTGIKHTVSLETVGYIAVVISKPLLSDEDSITSQCVASPHLIQM